MTTLKDEGDAAMPPAARQLEAEAEAGAGADDTMPSARQTAAEKAAAAQGTSPSASSDTVVAAAEQDKSPEQHRSAAKTFVLMFPLAVSAQLHLASRGDGERGKREKLTARCSWRFSWPRWTW